jgi:hypothetical protein
VTAGASAADLEIAAASAHAQPSLPSGLAPEAAEARDRATAAVFAGIVAAIMVLYYYNGTFGYEESAGRDSLNAASIAFFLIFFGHGCRAVLERVGVRPRPWLQSEGALSLAALALLCLAGRLTPFLPVSPLPVFGLIGVVSAVVAAAHAFQRPLRPAATALFVVFALFFSVRMAWFVLSGLEWTLANSGADRDLPYHAAIASMIQTYGVVATGVDGLVYQPYHFGSHWVAAQLANLTGSTLFTFYQSTIRALTISFFLHALLAFVITLRGRIYPVENRSAPPLRSDLVFWVVLYLGIIGVHRGLGVPVLEDYHTSVLGSESFVLAQAWAYLSFALLLTFFPRTSAVPLDALDRVFLCAVLPLLFAGLGLMKVSVMAVALPVAAWLFVRCGLFRRRVFWLSLLATIAAAAVVFWATRLWATNPPVLAARTSLEFARRYLAEPWQTSARVVAYVFWPALFVFSRLRQLGLGTLPELLSALRARRLVDVEVVVLACLIGFMPTVAGQIAGGGEIYFSIVPIIASLALLLGCRGLVFRAAAAAATALRRPGGPRLEWAVALLAAVPFLVLLAPEAYNPTGAATLVTNNVIVRTFVVPIKRLVVDVAGNRIREQRRARAAAPAAYATLRALNRLHHLPRAEKRTSLLFIPKTTEAYWKALNPVFSRSQPCMVRPFVAPAIAGIAMLDGRPEEGCIAVEAPAYNLTWRPPVMDTSDASVCAAAALRGFAHVYVMEDSRESYVSVREVSCGTS